VNTIVRPPALYELSRCEGNARYRVSTDTLLATLDCVRNSGHPELVLLYTYLPASQHISRYEQLLGSTLDLTWQSRKLIDLSLVVELTAGSHVSSCLVESHLVQLLCCAERQVNFNYVLYTNNMCIESHYKKATWKKL